MKSSIKPIQYDTSKLNPSEKFTSVEMGKLWATYVGNSMSNKLIRHFLQHVNDEDIKTLLENALHLTEDFMATIKRFMENENFPVPEGYTERDLNSSAPRLFEDEFYVHYLKYAAKAGLSLYAIALPLVMRLDIREFFVQCGMVTAELLGQINGILMDKGFIIKPPVLPTPEKVDFVGRKSYFNGFGHEVRPLHALEVTHLYDNIENNVTSKALLLGFSQVARTEKVRTFFIRGIEMTDKMVEQMKTKLHKENLPSPALLDHLVTNSTISPFSEKLMLSHKADMFSMKVRSMGNSMAVNGRKDIGILYGKLLISVALYAEDAAEILIENSWLEQPPQAADRNKLASE
ncbi:DUF3231 family protein [Mesobacillus jeotgali]|uniref:DUF3231 family protein n=1 Tax=Mesobacillus jeotgali TaxID=129985 RepID=UPI0009A6958B|nr:DUF3231 family protein [Mesobacillus jeotgali]